MAEGGQRRDPRSHKTPEQERRHTRKQQTKAEVEKRVKRNRDRARKEKQLGRKLGPDETVDHKKPLSRGGSSSLKNLRVISKSKNSGHGLTRGNGGGGPPRRSGRKR